MARADTYTLLPLDHYARLMAIHPDAFNQVVNPVNPYPGACERVWIQHGWMDYNTGRIVGREELAQAIYMAEEMIAYACGFWPAPCWAVGEEHTWPRPARGAQVSYPPIDARWGHIIEGGQRAMTLIDDSAAIVYSDEDGDGVLDTGTITVTAAQLAAAGAVREEVAIYFPERDGNDAFWIPDVQLVDVPLTGDVDIIGRRSLFVELPLWDVADDIDLSVNANFIDEVEVYRRYNDPSEQAQVVWQGGAMAGCSTTLCADTCQDACMNIEEKRLGVVRTVPATYSSGSWSLASFQVARLPDKARLWYRHGLLLVDLWNKIQLQPSIAEAIARLANTYLPAAPCGCDQTQYRWQRDREEQDINTYDTAMAMSCFGSTMKGAVFAWGVVKRLAPLAAGGALT